MQHVQALRAWCAPALQACVITGASAAIVARYVCQVSSALHCRATREASMLKLHQKALLLM